MNVATFETTKNTSFDRSACANFGPMPVKASNGSAAAVMLPTMTPSTAVVVESSVATSPCGVTARGGRFTAPAGSGGTPAMARRAGASAADSSRRAARCTDGSMPE
jgi:hypothetical protein